MRLILSSYLCGWLLTKSYLLEEREFGASSVIGNERAFQGLLGVILKLLSAVDHLSQFLEQVDPEVLHQLLLVTRPLFNFEVIQNFELLFDLVDHLKYRLGLFHVLMLLLIDKTESVGLQLDSQSLGA